MGPVAALPRPRIPDTCNATSARRVGGGYRATSRRNAGVNAVHRACAVHT
jgi:hypothetical protein